MKKLLGALLLAVLIPLQVNAQELWKEGEQYEVIADKATDKPEVLEFFSFWCPHCYRFESIVDVIKQKLPQNVKFNKVHVNFMGFTTPEIQNFATKAMMAGRVLKQQDVLNKAIFNYIHVQRAHITSINDLKNIAVVNGIDGDAFDKQIKGFGVNSLALKNNKIIDEYRAHVNSVPTFIVNGKYKAHFTRDMSSDDMVDLIVWLSQQK
ncbi:thiol:disulfide interchange protein DsbA/DsbL [Neptunicella marina]|uniref:Thiol:disulfide interchange protein n=1 Tax=Neptunicella marina TaxID=2125989 RepID=A0A8J6LXP7_9ALTE|nr:thiol:disulfide interchange protein DsbA/DsbL [Neptunicella marina]MBC3765744.1 thiol:disulfide interchange protein DsbA/DsbL [Neptunicella marina]